MSLSLTDDEHSFYSKKGNSMTNRDINTEADEFLPLRDVVFKKLRQAILTGAYKPGERLMEIHLADKLGVSRTPIREAIRKLELEGLFILQVCCCIWWNWKQSNVFSSA